YFVAFAIGTMIGMLAVSVSLASVVRLASTRGARWATLLHVGSAAASVAVGLLLAGRVAGEFLRSSMLVRLRWLTPRLLLGCLDAFAPAGAVPLTPPAVYGVWWTEIERCAGLGGDFDRVEWYQVPGSSYSCPAYEGQCDGWWRAPH